MCFEPLQQLLTPDWHEIFTSVSAAPFELWRNPLIPSVSCAGGVVFFRRCNMTRYRLLHNWKHCVHDCSAHRRVSLWMFRRLLSACVTKRRHGSVVISFSSSLPPVRCIMQLLICGSGFLFVYCRSLASSIRWHKLEMGRHQHNWLNLLAVLMGSWLIRSAEGRCHRAEGSPLLSTKRFGMVSCQIYFFLIYFLRDGDSWSTWRDDIFPHKRLT